MMPVNIRCCHLSPDAVIPPNLFFILSKGDNAGKPGLKPWTNCFVVTLPNSEMRDFYFWLTYGLYKAQCFKVIHRGTAVQFVNIGDLRKIITNAANIIYPSWEGFKTILQQVELLEQRKNNLAKILEATTTMQEYLVRSYLQQQGLK